jgi:hypothetical protein
MAELTFTDDKAFFTQREEKWITFFHGYTNYKALKDEHPRALDETNLLDNARQRKELLMVMLYV